MSKAINLDIRIGLKMDPIDGHYELDGPGVTGFVEVQRITRNLWVAVADVETGFTDPSSGLPNTTTFTTTGCPSELSAIRTILQQITTAVVADQINEAYDRAAG
jgi:hypothetical protein